MHPSFPRLICLVVVLFIFSPSIAQKIKIGKPSKEDFDLKECIFYPDAGSMIIAETGDLRFKYDDNSKQWQYVLETSLRKKIFSNEDKDVGTVKVLLYEPLTGNSKESLEKIKGYVFNGQSKEDKIKLRNEDVFTKRINDYWTEVSIVFPNVQKGSIIDLEYTIESDFINNLKTWNFQKEVPVSYSRFQFTIPEFFYYQISHEGSIISVETKNESINESFSYSYFNNETIKGLAKSNQNPGPSKQRVSLNSSSNRQIITATNIMPVTNEPFMNNKVNIPSRIEFQLSYYQFPGGLKNYVASDYNTYNKDLLDRSNFGYRLTKNAFAKEKIDELAGQSALNKSVELYEWIRNHFTWDGYNGFLSSDAGTRAFNEGKGDVADINLTFISALKKAGITCDPVILSTRGNGLPHPTFPSYDRFNYVIALIELPDGKTILADPSSNLPFGMLPYKCRNGNGWRVGNPQGGWISMKENTESAESTFIKMKIVDGKIHSTIDVKKEGYRNIDFVSRYQKDEEKVKENIIESLENWTVTNTQFDEMKLSVPSKHTVVAERIIEDGDVIYINPILSGSITENPFSREERISPVDFGYSRNYRVIAQIKIPDGYSVELPESCLLTLPNNSAKFTYTASKNGNLIQVMSAMQLSKLDHSPKEYTILRQFYQMVADKNNELVVLKKS